MSEHLEVRRGTYLDSVSLMNVSRAVGDLDGVEAALVAMATELNLEFLEPMGFDPGNVDAGPNDLLVAVRAVDDVTLERALATLESELTATRRGGDAPTGDVLPPRTTASAVRLAETADLVLVSTPGDHAFVEAVDALRAGANVMIFSDNVPVEAEVALKREADERGLLVMGPDCGTAMIAGVGLGFANVVRPGPVGVVAASGTGAQQLMCLLDDAGVGLSHVIGVGGRDLSSQVGGATTLAALARLDEDPATETIVVLSKPPADEVAQRVRDAAAACSTPVVLGLVGPGALDLTRTSRTVLERLGVEVPPPGSWEPITEDAATGRGSAAQFGYGGATSAGTSRQREPRSGALRGLFAGGTLCSEAVVIATEALGSVRSNVAPGDPNATSAHELLDLGEDEYTRGRPHPMIDNSIRIERIHEAGADPAIGILLLDVVLGHGAHQDPASELAPAIERARAQAAGRDEDLAVVVSLCGSAGDPQGRDRQIQRLREAGASVHLSNAAAAREAVRLVEKGTS